MPIVVCSCPRVRSRVFGYYIQKNQLVVVCTAAMGGKRKKSEMGEDDDSNGNGKRRSVDVDDENNQKKNGSKGQQLLPSTIKNKEKRSAVHAKLKQQKKLEKRKRAKTRDAVEKRALELGEEPPPQMIPRTIENTRELDETICKPDDEEMVEYARTKDFTSLIVVHTNRREPDALFIIGLPDGPTAHFKLSKLVLRKDIKSPNFRGQWVVTFHNQRDFIFFRHHRCIFESKETKQCDSKKGKDTKEENGSQGKMVARLQHTLKISKYMILPVLGR